MQVTGHHGLSIALVYQALEPILKSIFKYLKWCFGFFVPSATVHPYFSFIGVSANRLTGGAMQLTFRKMAFDYYPFHWAGRTVLHGSSPGAAQLHMY